MLSQHLKILDAFTSVMKHLISASQAFGQRVNVKTNLVFFAAVVNSPIHLKCALLT